MKTHACTWMAILAVIAASTGCANSATVSGANPTSADETTTTSATSVTNEPPHIWGDDVDDQTGVYMWPGYEGGPTTPSSDPSPPVVDTTPQAPVGSDPSSVSY